MCVVRQAGVCTMCLPAAYSTVHTWIQGFGLQPMPDEDLDAACKDLRLLIFPGTQVLHKQLLPPLPPRQGPLMTPPWAEEPAGPLTDDQPPVDPSAEPQQALDAKPVIAPLPVLEAKAEASAAATAVAAPSDMLLPVHTQPEAAPMLPSLAAAVGAADDTSLTEQTSRVSSDPAAAVQAAGDINMGEPATAASSRNQAVLQDAPGGPDAAPAETAQVLSTPPGDHDMLADVSPELASSEAAPHQTGDLSQAGLPMQTASPGGHRKQELDTVFREDDVDDKPEEASAATQDLLVQVHCSYTAMNQYLPCGLHMSTQPTSTV